MKVDKITELEKLYSRDEICKTLNLSPFIIREAVKRGDLKSVHVCKRVVFRVSDVQKWLEKVTK